MISVVVPVSGGKDSQACLKIACSMFPAGEIRGLFCDTKFEHPLTYDFIPRLAEEYGVQIDTVNAGSVEEKCLKYGRFPGGGARHCTEELKIIPSKKYYKALAEKQGQGFKVFYGMRFEESTERAARYAGKVSEDLYPPHEVLPGKYPKYLFDMGVMFQMPVIDWSKAEVFEFLDGFYNPLYDEGFDRVGCFPCLASGDKWKEKAFYHDEFGAAQRIKVRNIEDAIGKSVFTSKGGLQRNNPAQERLFDDPGCAFCSI